MWFTFSQPPTGSSIPDEAAVSAGGAWLRGVKKNLALPRAEVFSRLAATTARSRTHAARRRPRLVPSTPVSARDWTIDVDLLERWRGGDSRAGEQLFARHGDAVIRFFRNKIQDRGDAQDLIQDTFLRLVEARERIRDGQAFRGYVLGVARNVLLEHLRARPGRRELDPSVDSIAARLPGPSSILARRAEHQLLLEALRRISIDEQILLELVYWEQLNAKALGVMMDVNHSTMRSRIQHARDSLRQAMAELAESAALADSADADIDAWADQIRAEHFEGGSP